MQSSATPIQKNSKPKTQQGKREKEKGYNRQALREAKRQG